MAESGTRTQLINLEGLNTFLNESKKIFEPTLPAGTNGQVLKLSGGKPTWGTDNTPTTFSWTGGTTAGPTGSLTGNGMSAVAFPAIPVASESASGVVTTGAQTFAGTKTFSSPITGSLNGNASTATAADKTAHSLSVKDGAATPVAAINSWNGSTDKTLTIKGESPVTTTATDGTITITHATSGATAGTYKSVTVDAKGHVTGGTNPSTLSGYGITDAKIANGVITLGSNTITPLTASSTLAANKVSGTLAADNIPKLDASKIDSGTIAIERLPATALERCVVVANDTARFALKTSSVQVGDTVKVTATKKMYMVIDSSKLSSEAGYEEYFTSTDWSTITNKPSSYTPSSHTHTKSQITDFPSSMPASDVYAWAKAENKPSYAWGEITDKPSTFTPASHTHSYAGSSSAGGPANDFVAGQGTDDADRYVYFAYNDTTYNNSSPSSITKGRAVVDSEFKYNPSTNTLTVGTVKGSLSGTASKATNDSADQKITTTYIKGLSVSGKTITYTKGDGSTGTITTQDTTYTVASGDNNGQIKVTPSSGDAYNVSVKGLGSRAYDSTDYLALAGGTVTGITSFSNAEASSSTTTGAVKISGGLGVAGDIYAGAVHNAVWNDLVDCMEIPEDTSLEYGYCYSWEGNNVIKSSRSSKNCIGIHSNTAGFAMGEKKTKTIRAAVAGFVLAYVDKLYPEGTPLTWGDNGTLTKCSLLKRVLHPERIIATFYKEEKEEKWHNLPVSGRHWVKVV